MEKMNRRELCAAFSAFATISSLPIQAQGLKVGILSQSLCLPFDKLPVTHQAGGGEIRQIVHGILPTGETVDIHETSLPVGHMPHPPHKHVHSEFMLVREGLLEFYSDGKSEMVSAGGVIFAASGVMHGWKNVGTTPASYYVVAIGLEPQ